MNKYVHDGVGANSRLDELQAAFLRARLARLDDQNARRRAIARAYREHMQGINALQLPDAAPDAEHAYHLFVVRTPQRNVLAEGLRARGIGTMVHYPRPPHRQGAFADADLRVPLPVTEAVADDVLSLPMWPGLSEGDVADVAKAVREVLAT